MADVAVVRKRVKTAIEQARRDQAERRGRVDLDEQSAPSPINRLSGVSESGEQAGSPHRYGRDPVRTDCERDNSCHRLCNVQVGSAAGQRASPLESRLTCRGGCSPGTMGDKEVNERLWPPKRAVDGGALCGDDCG